MKGDWKEAANEIVHALKKERAVAIFGLCGISLEDQHRAFHLARALGASVSVHRVLLPTVTVGALSRHKLVLVTGNTRDIPLPEGVCTLQDERLNSAEAWRLLRILQRGHTTAEADAFRQLYEQIVQAEGAAFLLVSNCVSEELRTELQSFRAECALPLGLDYLQITSCINLLGAYETALEEAGGAYATFAGGMEHADDAFALEELLSRGALGAALLIGDCIDETDSVLAAGVPLYVAGGKVKGAARSIPAELKSPGGTILRDDGLPVRMTETAAGGLVTLTEVLETMIAEARAC